MQRKTQQPVQFEITEQTREALTAWIQRAWLRSDNYFSRADSVAQCTCLCDNMLVSSKLGEASVGLDSLIYGTHTWRRTKALLIYRRTKNLRAVQLLLGHTKLEITIRYLGIEVDDNLETAEQKEA